MAPLYYAVALENLEMVKLLLESPEIDVNIKSILNQIFFFYYISISIFMVFINKKKFNKIPNFITLILFLFIF